MSSVNTYMASDKLEVTGPLQVKSLKTETSDVMHILSRLQTVQS